MRPEDLRVALRPRTGLEAIALGLTLARVHAARLWPVWLGFVLPLSLLLNLLLAPLQLAWLAGLLLWWLKPMGERAVLELLARATFGQELGRGPALRLAWTPDRLLWPCLLWRRLGMARSLLMPADRLEGAPPHIRRQRRSYLLRQDGVTGFVCSWLFASLELLLMAGILSVALLMVPPEMLGDTLRDGWETLRESQGNSRQLVANLLLTLAICVTGPFYVACGFALYINRRTRSEGWDLELGLRRLARRLAASAPALAAVLLLALALGPAPLQATTPVMATLAADAGDHASAGQAGVPARFQRAVEQAYRHPDLGQVQQHTTWQRPEHPGGEHEEGRLQKLGKALHPLLGLALESARVLLWAVAVTLLLALLWAARRWLRLRGRRASDAPGANVLTIALATAEPLPADPAARARQLWHAGQQRQALALLYRASVAALSRQLPQPLADGATEAQCLQAAQQLGDPRSRELFTLVVRHWQLAAWAGRLPSDAGFQALADALDARRGWL